MEWWSTVKHVVSWKHSAWPIKAGNTGLDSFWFTFTEELLILKSHHFLVTDFGLSQCSQLWNGAAEKSTQVSCSRSYLKWCSPPAGCSSFSNIHLPWGTQVGFTISLCQSKQTPPLSRINLYRKLCFKVHNLIPLPWSNLAKIQDSCNTTLAVAWIYLRYSLIQWGRDPTA